MEIQKNSENFSFGFGTMKAAGLGSAAEAKKIPLKQSSKSIAKNALKTGAKAAGVTAVFLLKHKAKKKH